jgi:hypothetical protein
VADTLNILTPLQRRFLDAFSKTELTKDFFLTGGTALAHFYLQHRLSEDLDFFTEVPGAVVRVRPILDSIAIALSGSLKVRREYETFLEVLRISWTFIFFATSLCHLTISSRIPKRNTLASMNIGWPARLRMFRLLRNYPECLSRSMCPLCKAFLTSRLPA